MKRIQLILFVGAIVFYGLSGLESIRCFALHGEASYLAFAFLMVGVGCSIARRIIVQRRSK